MSSRSGADRRGLALVAVGIIVLARAGTGGASESPPPSDAPQSFPNVVEGPVGGKPFEVRSALAGKVWGTGGGVGVIILSDQPETCELRAAKKQKANARRIHLVLSFNHGGVTSPPEGVGSFVVGGYRRVEYSDVFVESHGARCEVTKRTTVKKGVVKLRNYPREDRPNAYGGTFDLVVGKEHVKGSFTAPLCGALSSGVADPPDAEEPACE